MQGSRSKNNEFDSSKHILVVNKLKDVFSNKLYGYTVGIKGLPLKIDIDTAIKLIKLGYIKGVVQNNRVSSFTHFKNLECELVPYPDRIDYSTLESVIHAAKVAGLSPFESIRVARTTTIIDDKKKKQRELQSSLSNQIISSSRGNDNIYICKLLRRENTNETAGYVLARNGELYNVTKSFCIKLAQNGKLFNAKASTNSAVGDYVTIKEGNRNILTEVISQVDMDSLLEELPFDAVNTNHDVVKKTITGCIFNELGKIIGVTIEIGTKRYNLTVEKILEYAQKTHVRLTKGVTDSQYEKFKYAQNMETHKLYGVEFVRTLKLIHVAMTIEMSEELFGKENTIVVDTRTEYGDKEIRKKAIDAEKVIVESILKTGRNWKIPRSRLEIVGRVKVVTLKNPTKLAVAPYYVVIANGMYLVVSSGVIKGALKNVDINNLPFITLWNSEIRYSVYGDGNDIIVSAKNKIRNSIKKQYEAISNK